MRPIARSFVLAICLGSALAAQSTIKVPDDQPTIQAAIQVAVNGDTVLVSPGTYPEQIDFLGKAIVVKSSGGATKTIIDSQDQSTWPDSPSNAVVRFKNGEGAGSVLQGFTVTGLSSVGGSGFTAPVFCDAGAQPSIRFCIVSNNKNGHAGGVWGDPSLSDCLILNNTTRNGSDGGGVHGAPTIVRCVISGNQAISGNGGGVFATAPCDIKGSAIVHNQAGSNGRRGGGVFGAARISDCLLFENSASYFTQASDQGSAVDGAISIVSSTVVYNTIIDPTQGQNGGGITNTPVISNCILWGNNENEIGISAVVPTVTFCDVLGGYAGTGNLNLDPLFVDVAVDDYKLQPVSPCIDAGDPSHPQDGDLTRADIGALWYAQIDASVTSANGTGINPPNLTSANLPVIGTQWTAFTSSAGYPGTQLAFLFGVGDSLAPLPTRFGELLIDLASQPIIESISSIVARKATHSVWIPNDPGLVGLDVHCQSALVGPSIALCNALDLILGH